ncbi:SDR family oxidoreductase [Flavobacteriaceae bacterium]|nr:SDR family oxidoreductase [Flavobacteriaceae bacterium]
MNLKLKNKVAIVTGASKGMGLAICETMLNEGVKVMMVSRNEKLLKELKEKYTDQKFHVDFCAGDVSSPDLHETVIERTMSRWGSIHILINNAGGPPMGSFLEQNDSSWDGAFQTNLMSVIRFSKAVTPHMKKNKWGRIVSITSSLAIEPSPVMVLSSTIRAGVSSFTKAISSELASENITVNVICPGGVLTERLKSLIEDRTIRENRSYEEILNESQASIPANRFASSKEIADTILFLTSENGSYITGVSLAVDGGLLRSY